MEMVMTLIAHANDRGIQGRGIGTRGLEERGGVWTGRKAVHWSYTYTYYCLLIVPFHMHSLCVL